MPEILRELLTTGAYAPAVALCCALVVLLGSCAVLVGYDSTQHRLPNRWTLGLAGGGVVLLVLTTLLAEEPHLASGRVAAILGGSLGYAALMLVLHLVTRGGFGMGDVKLGLGLGAYTGFVSVQHLVLGVLLALIFAALAAAVLLLTRRATAQTAIAYGPYMIAGSLLPLMVMW